MNKKVVYKILFMLSATVLICIGLLALLVMVINLRILLSDDSHIWNYEYEREIICSIITFCAKILAIDFLFMLILFFIFKKNKKKDKNKA